MVRTNGKWMVYDVVIEGVSFVNNYRKQFNEVLTNRNFDHLLSVLRDKIAQLEKS
jgi:phospholipid transport system substrate-binding protein